MESEKKLEIKGVIENLAKRRKTIRNFKKETFDIDLILYAISAAKEAPSGMNAQPWYFLIISNEEIKSKLRKICEEGEQKFYESVRGPLKEFLKENQINWKKEFLTQAPYLILVFSDKRYPYSKESTWLSIGYLLLALEENNLSSLTYTPSNPSQIEKFLNTPNNYKLEVIIPVGYSNEDKKKLPRKDTKDVLGFENF